MTNYNIKYFIPHIKKNDYEFYVKFCGYCKRFQIPKDIQKDIDKLFIE